MVTMIIKKNVDSMLPAQCWTAGRQSEQPHGEHRGAVFLQQNTQI